MIMEKKSRRGQIQTYLSQFLIPPGIIGLNSQFRIPINRDVCYNNRCIEYNNRNDVDNYFSSFLPILFFKDIFIFHLTKVSQVYLDCRLQTLQSIIVILYLLIRRLTTVAQWK